MTSPNRKAEVSRQTKETQIAVAVDLYAEQGWRPWTCRFAA